MRIIICLLLVVLTSYCFSDKIRKFYANIYFVFGVMSLLTMTYSILGFNGYVVTYLPGIKQVMDAILSGALGGSFFILVMYMGAVSMSFKPMKKLRIIRGELSIIAGIITIPHNFHYFINFIISRNSLLKGGVFSVWTNLMMFTSAIFAIAIMWPLFVTSFKHIRKKMTGKKWKSLQEYAYIFYAMIFVQVIMVYLSRPTSVMRNINIAFYVLLFASYTALKIDRLLNKSKKIKVSEKQKVDYQKI